MHPPGDLAVALASLPGQPFDGVLYRAVFLEALYGFHSTPPYPAPRPLFSLGAPRHGARFTPPEGMPTLYAAEDPETALAEAHQVDAALRRRHPDRVPPAAPTVLISLRARLDTVLDVTIAAVQHALDTNRREIVRPWRLLQARGQVPATHLLGEVTFTSDRFQAIRYPSTRSRGRCCLAIFPDRLVAPAFVEVYDPDGNLCERIP
jgi:RES domain-containing protein